MALTLRAWDVAMYLISAFHLRGGNEIGRQPSAIRRQENHEKVFLRRLKADG